MPSRDQKFDQHFFKSVISDAQFFGATMPVDASLSVDSRTIKKGELFAALGGARVDGHDFILDALNNGAAGIIIAQKRKDCLEKISPVQLRTLFVAIVPDVYNALCKLATAWRQQFSYPVIGITGSIGKTSTKEMLVNVIRHAGKNCIASQGNQNTAIGISLNILKMRAQHDCAIFEVGINKRGEMAKLADILNPTSALITAIGHSHMEGLGSLGDIAAEKRDIFKNFKEDSIGIINGDQPILSTIAYKHPLIKFGCKTINQIQARKIRVDAKSTTFVLKLYKERYTVTLPSNHQGRVFNALGCIAAAHLLNIPHKTIIEGIQQPLSVAGRFETRVVKNSPAIIINDCYNASPESMKAALLAFEKIESTGTKMAILGDMLELGVTWEFWHRQLGRLLRKAPSVRQVILVGKHSESALKTMPLHVQVEHVPTWKEAADLLAKKIDSTSMILVKASRGIGLDNLVKQFSEQPKAQ